MSGGTKGTLPHRARGRRRRAPPSGARRPGPCGRTRGRRRARAERARRGPRSSARGGRNTRSRQASRRLPRRRPRTRMPDYAGDHANRCALRRLTRPEEEHGRDGEQRPFVRLGDRRHRHLRDRGGSIGWRPFAWNCSAVSRTTAPLTGVTSWNVLASAIASSWRSARTGKLTRSMKSTRPEPSDVRRGLDRARRSGFERDAFALVDVLRAGAGPPLEQPREVRRGVAQASDPLDALVRQRLGGRVRAG